MKRKVSSKSLLSRGSGSRRVSLKSFKSGGSKRTEFSHISSSSDRLSFDIVDEAEEDENEEDDKAEEGESGELEIGDATPVVDDSEDGSSDEGKFSRSPPQSKHTNTHTHIHHQLC